MVAAGGMTTAAISFEELLSGVFELQGAMFVTEAKLLSKKGKAAKYRYTDYYTEMTKETKGALTDVFMAIAQTMGEVGKTLGQQIGQDFSAQLNAYVIPSLKIDLMGLNGKEAVDKVNGVISTAMDQMATVVFGDIVGQYQKLGEGMLETAIRVVAQVAVVKDALGQSGLKMADDALALSDALVTAAGGLKEFQEQFEAYYDKFYSDGEKNTRLQGRLASQLSDVNLVLPETKEGYRKLLESLNLSNEGEAERYSLLLKLAEAADTYYSAITDATEATKAAAEAQQDYYTNMAKGANDAVKKARDALTAAYKAQNTEITSVISKLTTFVASMKAFRESLVLSNLSTGTPLDKYTEARRQLYASYDTIKGGAGTTKESQAAYDTALKELQDKAKTFLDTSRIYNASGSQYTDDYNTVLAGIDGVSGLVGAQLSDAQKQLDAMNAANASLNTINNSVLSVKDATDNLYLAINAQAEMTAAIERSKAAGGDLSGKQAVYDAAATAQKSAQATYDVAVAKYNNEQAAIEKWKLDANRAVTENKAYALKAADSGDQQTLDRLAAQLPGLLENARAANASLGASGFYVSQAKAALATLNDEKANAAAALATSKNYYDATTKLITYLDSTRSAGDLIAELTQYGIAALGRQLTAFEADWISQQVTAKANVYDTYASIDTYAMTNGSHKNGLDFVPFDGYRAELHKGERVLTANQAKNDGVISQEVIAELKALRSEVAQLRKEQKDHTGALIQSNYDANDKASDKVVAGSKDATKNVLWASKSKAVIV